MCNYTNNIWLLKTFAFSNVYTTDVVGITLFNVNAITVQWIRANW